VQNTRSESFSLAVSGDLKNFLGFGGAITGASSAVTYTTLTAGSAALGTNTNTGTISILVEGAGGASIDISAAGVASGTAQQLADQLNSAIAASPTLTKAALQATVSAGSLVLTSNNGTHFQIESKETANNVLGFGIVAAAAALSAAVIALPTAGTFDSGGAQATSTPSGLFPTAPTAFTPLFYGNDVQNLVFNAKDAQGNVHSLSVQLTNANAATLDQAINTINTKLQQSEDSTLNQIVAVKDQIPGGGNTEGIKFLSGVASGFTVGIGNTASGNGVSTSGNSSLLTSAALAGGSTTDTGSQANASSAVSLLALAVNVLASSQATVGKGENQLQYAINLATTESTNLSVAEGRIRDADLAAEAANLTKTSIALQSGIAALAQANSAPQAVLALLRG